MLINLILEIIRENESIRILSNENEPSRDVISNNLLTNKREEINNFEIKQPKIPQRQMMFSSNQEVTARITKEEIKEEIKEGVEEEKELQRQDSRSEIFPTAKENNENVEMQDNYTNEEDDSEGSDGFQEQNDSESEEEIIQEENPEPEIDMNIESRINNRTLITGINQANSFHTRAEANSSIENLSHTMTNIQLPNEFQNVHSAVNNRRILSQLMGANSIDSSDDYNGENSRNHFREVLEEQIDSIKISFVHTISHEKANIHETKRELRQYVSLFEKKKKQEWERIQMEKEV